MRKSIPWDAQSSRNIKRTVPRDFNSLKVYALFAYWGGGGSGNNDFQNMLLFSNSSNVLTLSAPASLSACEFSLHYLHKISCLVMRINQMIIHSNLFRIKTKFSQPVFQGNYRDSLGEFSNASYAVFGAERVNCLFLSFLQDHSVSLMKGGILSEPDESPNRTSRWYTNTKGRLMEKWKWRKKLSWVYLYPERWRPLSETIANPLILEPSI